MSKLYDKTKKIRISDEVQKALDSYRKKFVIPPNETATLNQAALIGLKHLSK